MEAEDIILKNIRLFRKLKDIKSENMAKALGISQSEYSKLENGLKRKWTEYLPKIAEILGLSFQELVNLNAVIQGNYSQFNNRVNEPASIMNSTRDKELYERLIFELKEKERLKDELLNSLLLTKETYKKKYEIIRAKLFFEETNFNERDNYNI